MSDKPTWVGLFGSDPDMGKGHEPECESPSPAGHCIECDQLRAAYQRGREDATKAVEAVAEPFFLTRFNPIDEDAWAVFVNMLAAARGDVADKTDKNTGGHGGLVSRENVSPSSVATTYNIDDPEAVVNVIRAAVVNVRQASNVNVRGDGEQ